MTPFRLSGLDPTTFIVLFERDDETLARSNIRRVRATAAFGFPCRISLEDAAVGEELLLLPFQHLPQASPYQASGPIFVRRGVAQSILAPGEIPPYVARRLISLRAYDAEHLMRDADVVDGASVAHALSALLARPEIAYVHLHNAKRGCYSCLAQRA